MGRTGSLHAVEQEGIAPDLMTIAKGLGGGYQAIGAVRDLRKRVLPEALTGTGARFYVGGKTAVVLRALEDPEEIAAAFAAPYFA